MSNRAQWIIWIVTAAMLILRSGGVKWKTG